MTRFGLPLLALVVVATSAPAQVLTPPRPDNYDVHFRYRIRAARDERIRQFRELEQFLKGIGFVQAPREGADLDIFDPAAEVMNGTLPAENAARLFVDSRILSAVLIPAGRELPADPNTPVQVSITLVGGLAPQAQRQLHEQVAAHLGHLGFKEAVAYDTNNYHRVRGAIPAANLLTLLKDLRNQPTGWFVPVVPRESLPMPLRNVLPVRVVEVLPDLPASATPPATATPDTPAPPAAPPPAEGVPAQPPADTVAATPKFTPELAALLADTAAQDRPLRVEAILEQAPREDWRDIQFRIRSAAEGLSVEGLIGQVATVRLAHGRDAARLATLPNVRHIRLPRAGSETAHSLATGAQASNPAEVLSASKVTELHNLGYRGQGTRLVIVGSEFPGILNMVGKQLPNTTRVIDLTAELNPDLLPNPANPNRPGIGTVAALTAHASAPHAELVLVRIDPTAFHQLLTVARAASGSPSYSEAMQTRSQELVNEAESLNTRRSVVTEQYRRAFATLSDNPASVKARKEASTALEQVVADERTYNGAVERFTALKAGLDSLRGTAVVINTLVWDAGYPQDGLSAMSQALEERFLPTPVRSSVDISRQPSVPIWVQAASTAVGQVWAGPYRDSDSNSVLEFAPPEAPLPKERWTRELNFLSFEPNSGKATTTLPAGFELQITVQWREPRIDAGVMTREPAYPLTLRLLRQLDPAGKVVSSDEFVEVAHSTGEPVRLLVTNGSAAYEQTLLVTIPADGVYALRVEGGSSQDELLPALQRGVEISPRIVLQPADAENAKKGSPLFATFPTIAAGVGVPGDSSAAVTVGILGPEGKAVGTLTGTGPGVTLRTKPDLLTTGVWAADGIGASGSAVSAAFAGGAGASLRSAGVRVSDIQKSLGLNPGRPLVLPDPLLLNISNPRRGSER